MANKDQIEKMCVSHLGSNDKTDPADVSESTIRHNTTVNITMPFKSDIANEMTCYILFRCVLTYKSTIQNCKYCFQ